MRDVLAPYDVEHDAPVLFDCLPMMRDVGNFSRQFSLRSAEEIDRARDLAELWHWRSRTHELMDEGYVPADGPSLAEIVRMTATFAHERGDIAEPVGDDFPIYAKPYRAVTDEQYWQARSIAIERHYALNWLCGYARDWDKVPTDT